MFPPPPSYPLPPTVPSRFLLAMCSGGQLSNRLACFRQNLLDATLLNRTLVIPMEHIDYNYNELLGGEGGGGGEVERDGRRDGKGMEEGWKRGGGAMEGGGGGMGGVREEGV